MKKIVSSIGLFFLFAVVYGQEGFRINHQPYLQNVSDSSATIVWTTNQPATAWVEVAPNDSTHFYASERPRFFDAAGGIKNISKIHKVTLNGLKPGTKYRYRVYSQEVLGQDFVYLSYGNVAATAVYRTAPLEFTTPVQKSEIVFAVLNDIHERNDVLRKLLTQLDFSTTDFVVFNGDMVNQMRTEEVIFSGFLDTATQIFANKIPFYYARGNHETRGAAARTFIEYFPTSTGQIYYTLKKGDAFFIFLDTGEDKPDSDIEYSGITDMDAYRTVQAEWLQGVLQSKAFKEAKYKIVIGHIPPFGGWHGNKEVAEKFVKLMNAAGVQIMLAAHTHRLMFEKANALHSFPILVNGNNSMIKVKITKDKASFTVVGLDGKSIFSTEL